MRREPNVFSAPAFKAVKTAAESHGLPVKNVGKHVKTILVGGQISSIHTARKAFRTTSTTTQKYWHFKLNDGVLAKTRATILVGRYKRKPHFFVIPNEVFSRQDAPVSRVVYIPLHGRDPKGRGRRKDSVDFLKYEDAWHLLRSRNRSRSKRKTASAASRVSAPVC